MLEADLRARAENHNSGGDDFELTPRLGNATAHARRDARVERTNLATTEEFLMPELSRKKPALLVPAAAARGTTSEAKTLPAVLQSPTSRSATGQAEPLVDVEVVETYLLSPASRSEVAPRPEKIEEDERLLAIEASDGSTVFIRADRLKETLTNLHPEQVSDEGVDLALLRDPEGATRGFGDWVWKRLSVLQLKPDAIADYAREKAIEWVGEKLAEKLGENGLFSASTLGTKALMEAIESKLSGAEGLYHWHGPVLSPGDLCRVGDARLSNWGSEPALVFVHGTGSHTVGSFGDLRSSRDWPALERIFGDRIFGFEHRTFSKSPIDNALMLAETLPAGSRLAIVTHSRGGLVGDLLCLGGFTPDVKKLIEEYRRFPRPDEEDAEKQNDSLREQRERVAADEQEKLTKLVELLDNKNLQIERYVRVACPAAGTTLLSDNLEVFLSGLLTLVRKLGAWGSGAVVGAIATPVAGQAAKQMADQALKLLSRVVLEIADKRLQPHFVPGIEAMLTDAPMGAFLARAPRRSSVRMAVIAGDIEGGGLLKRIGVMFTDWMFFDRDENDLVVDTDSMYAGLVASSGAHALFDQGDEVNHFSYFRNPRTREALRDWLLNEDPLQLAAWASIASPGEAAERLRISRGFKALPPDNTRPVVIYVPGIMGSNLEIDRKDGRPGSGNRIWLDFVDLPRGGLARIKRGVSVWPDDLVSLAYGRLAGHLEATHRVIRFPYDWRNGLSEAAQGLQETVQQALKDHPRQPVRILAHSMGGLVTRTLFAQNPELWDAIVQRPGGRFLMLGTPNHGSHLMVETLLGKSGTIRMLGRVDLRHSLQEILDIIAEYVGALGLLPEPGFKDAGGPAARNYYQQGSWDELANINDDFWFGKKLGGRPVDADLADAKTQWELLAHAPALAHPERIAYVFGQDKNTPCGIDVRKNSKGNPVRIEMLGTPHGDGSVTWASGRLEWLPGDRHWYIPVNHGGLVNTPDYFTDIVELLNTGASTHLKRLPVSRGVAQPPIHRYNAAPPPGFFSEVDFVAQLIGGRARPLRPSVEERALAVSVKAMDLRFARQPVMCGHYIGDPIAGAELSIDVHLVNGALTRREHLGIYAREIGTAAVVLMPRSSEERLRDSARGAVIVGLGEFGKLTSEKVAETVRAGVLRLLLHAGDCDSEGAGFARKAGGPLEIKLSSVLLGFNSTTHISVDESVAAVVRGVCEANRQFSDNAGAPGAAARVAALEFIEVFQDAAITAARAVANLPVTMAKDLRRLNVRLEAERELRYGDGVRPRLSLSAGASYWPRLMISDADRGEEECPASCFDARVVSTVPPEALSRLMKLHGYQKAEPDAAWSSKPPRPRYAERLKFVFLSERARAEAVVQQRQPGLIESLISAEVTSCAYDKDRAIGRILFQLLVPMDFKSTASEAHNLLLVLDGYTANFPWEMLQVKDEPIVIKTRLVRQLMSTRFRSAVRTTRERTACVIVNPSTKGYFAQFGGPGWKSANDPDGKPEPDADQLKPLPSAEHEGEAVRAILEAANYDVTFSPGGAEANEVIGVLFKRPYRILAIAAHGVFQVTARDGSVRSGVVLSNGALLTAAEVGQMEIVPELVYLSCCNLGKTDNTAGAAPTRLAYSLARELIEMGVRCVVAAGWEVEDNAACTFATTFFDCFINARLSFGNAIFAARTTTYEAHRNVNTWGAYQAYGDPSFTLGGPADGGGASPLLLAPEELLDWLSLQKLNASQARKGVETDEQRLRGVQASISGRLRDLPAEWRDRPDVQQALGGLFAEYGEAGFDAAREAYLRAIAEECKVGAVPLATIEQLANLEARTAEKLLEPKSGKLVDSRMFNVALDRVECAIARLSGLIRITGVDPNPDSPRPESSATPRRVNTERWSLLGSAYKRKAVVLARTQGVKWNRVETALGEARNAYARAESSPDDANANPYPMINRLQLDALVHDFKNESERQDAIQLATLCAERARKRFTPHGDWFDAIMPADAEVAIYLLGGALADPENSLTTAYKEASDNVSRSARQLDSVVKQLRFLSRFLELRAAEHDSERAGVLAAVALHLDPNSTVVVTPSPLAPQPGRAGKRQRKQAS